MSPPSQWFPSRREQALKWWLELALKYGIGGGGCVYELLIDHLHNYTALVVFGGIAGGTELYSYRASMKREAEQEARARTRTKRKRATTRRPAVKPASPPQAREDDA